ncbi:hypothetical protein SASPL_130970 [Salvia splendens]|uniref:ENT domain-containing protein n=1 Tax=Salvia splendens TaxID=180675 RepID=A0A8X8ZL54_SALSN|nr:hypothetical protein SASPL_130970 [Salvia splendens]
MGVQIHGSDSGGLVNGGKCFRPSKCRQGQVGENRSVASCDREKVILLVALKDLVAHGWKSDNGFRAGYLTQTEEFDLSSSFLLPLHGVEVERLSRRSCGGERKVISTISPISNESNGYGIRIHNLEQIAYDAVLRAFKAQSDALTWVYSATCLSIISYVFTMFGKTVSSDWIWLFLDIFVSHEKEGLITELRKELRVSDDEYRNYLVRSMVMTSFAGSESGGRQVKDGNAKYMRNKPWPHWDSWNEVFGKKCAIGGRALDSAETVNKLASMQRNEQENFTEFIGAYYPMSFEELFPDEVLPEGMNHNVDSGSNTNVPNILNVPNVHVIPNVPNTPKEASLTLKHKFHVGQKLVKEPELISLGLPEIVRPEYVMFLLDKEELI